eukprot:6179272-Pleurochrysis_carterae.AAC.1
MAAPSQQAAPVNQAKEPNSNASDGKPHFQASGNVVVALTALESSAQRPQMTTLAPEGGAYGQEELSSPTSHSSSGAMQLQRGAAHRRWQAVGSLEACYPAKPDQDNSSSLRPSHAAAGDIPSGKQKCDVLHAMKEKMWKDEQ